MGLRYRLRGGLGRAAIAPGGIAGESVGQDPPGSGELIADEAETQQPAAHGVALILALQRLVFRSAGVQSAIVHRQAKLDVGFQLTRVQTAPAANRTSGVEVIELEAPELHTLALEEAVQIQGVMLSST